MATVTEQAIGSLQYDRPKSVLTTAQNLATEYRLAATAEANQMLIDQWVSLDPDNVAQVTTITITAGADGDLYDLEVDDGVNPDVYSYRQKGAMSATDIAMALARRLDLHPAIRATSANNIITATGVVPGVAITFDEANSTTPGNLIIADTTTANGTPLTRLISRTTINWQTDPTGNPKVNYQTTFYNGNETPEVNNNGPLVEGKGSLSLDNIQTANGIARPT